MKAYILTTVLSLLFVVVVGIITDVVGHNIASDFIAELDELESLVDHEEWEQAQHRCDSLSTQWETRQTGIEFLVQHGDTDHINLNIDSLKAALKEQETLHAHIFLTELKEGFHHIDHRDALTFSNIF